MSAEPGGGHPELAELRQQARRLVAEVAGPLRRVHLRTGEAVLEIEWHVEEDSAAAEPVPPRPATGNGGRSTITAPMVGTYYRAPEPGAPPFVEPGDKVEPGQVVGIVEAMKLMNEILADQAGRVVEVLVSDGEPVEFGQPLIALVAG